MPKIAVIVATFNRAALLQRALVSALQQTFTDFELIVVDDGSRDDTAEVLAGVAAQDPRVRVVHQANAGLAAARLNGFRHSCAEWVTFLDDDDRVLPQHLASRLELTGRFPRVDLWQGGFQTEGDPWVVDYFDRAKLIHTDAVVVGATFFMRRQVFEELGGFRPLPFGDDTDFWARAVRRFVCGQLREPRTYLWLRAKGSMSDIAPTPMR